MRIASSCVLRHESAEWDRASRSLYGTSGQSAGEENSGEGVTGLDGAWSCTYGGFRSVTPFAASPGVALGNSPYVHKLFGVAAAALRWAVISSAVK
jgi:hypothetical protein